MKSLKFVNPRVGDIDMITDRAVRLVTLEGVSAEANVNMQSVAGYNGATLQSTAVPERYITVNFRIRKQADAEAAMTYLYRLFAATSSGTMHFKGRRGGCQIDYVVQQCVIPPNNKDLTGTLILVCPDPFFRAEQEHSEVVAGSQSSFMFPFVFPPYPFYISRRMANLFTEIYNDGGADTDITITMTANGTVVNPYLQDVDTLAKSALRMTLQRGDKVVITTKTDGKTATLYRGGNEQNIFNYLAFPFTFFKLAQGMNTFTYGAESGQSKLDIVISFSARYGAIYTNAPYEDEFRISDDEILGKLDDIAKVVERGGFNA